MKASVKSVLVLSAALLGTNLIQSTQSFAYYWHHETYYHECYSEACREADGTLASILLSTLSLETTADAADHNAETRQVEAVSYLETGVKGAVFDAFEKSVLAKMTNEQAQKVQALSPAEIDQIVATIIVEQGLN